MRVGFIGLGNVGGPMAANLARAGYDVKGFDPADPTVEGVVRTPSSADAADDCDVVITMLPNGKILSSVYDEILPVVKKGALLIDCSTVDVSSALSAHSNAMTAGLHPLDAPVSGGISGAANGTLTFMVGGSAEAFKRAEPLFAAMGQKTVHCGKAGSGQIAKICNNMVLGISMIAVCEAFALGDKLGISAEKLFDVISTSSGACWSVNTYCPVPGVGPKSPADNDYRPGFAAELMLKDLALSQNAAEIADVPTVLGAAAAAFYQDFVERGGRGKDFSAVLPHISAAKRGEL